MEPEREDLLSEALANQFLYSLGLLDMHAMTCSILSDMKILTSPLAEATFSRWTVKYCLMNDVSASLRGHD